MYIYYLIFSTYQKIPVFSSDKIKNILLQSIYFCVKKYNCNIYAYSIIPCHVNLVINFQYMGQHLEFERDFKSFTHNAIIKLLDQNKINDYQFICGTNCGCRKIKYYGPKIPRYKFTKETLEIIKKRRKIWKTKCFYSIIYNQETFDKIKKYSYFNPVKHHLIDRNKLGNYKWTYHYKYKTH